MHFQRIFKKTTIGISISFPTVVRNEKNENIAKINFFDFVCFRSGLILYNLKPAGMFVAKSWTERQY